MTTKIPGPAYRIDTARMVIRCWEPVDAPLLKAAIDESLEHLRPWMPWTKWEPTGIQEKIDTIRRFRGQFDLGQDFVYGVFSNDQSMVLGGTGLHLRSGQASREIGYWIHKDHINQGLATELSAALTRVAFEVDGVDRIEIHCDPRNRRSATVPNKLGFQLEATLGRRLKNTEGAFRDTMIWTLFAADYPNSPASAAEIKVYDAMERQIL